MRPRRWRRPRPPRSRAPGAASNSTRSMPSLKRTPASARPPKPPRASPPLPRSAQHAGRADEARRRQRAFALEASVRGCILGACSQDDPMQLSVKPALLAKTYEVEDFTAAQELYHSHGWTDGLPVVPPTEAAVAACLEWAGMPPDQLIGIEPVRAQPISAEKLAINAVMAGCLPMHFPAVVTAVSAMLQPEFLLHGATASTGGCAVFVVLNGPIRREIGAAGSFNALGNSDRATAVIGRAIRLALINMLEVRPGGIDRSTIGHPGKYSYCVAEDDDDGPWLPLHVQ